MLGVGLRRILCQHVPRVTPGTRAKNYSLPGVTPGPGPAWGGKDYLLLLAMRRRRGCPRNRRSRCSGAAWWTPGGAYIEHARVAEVTGELLPAQPGRLPGLVIVVVIVAPRRPTMSARHATPSSRPPHGSARRARVITA